MRSFTFVAGLALSSVLLGCATTPVALAPVGPNPAGAKFLGRNGQLEVYSATVGRWEGTNPTWRQHSDYFLYNRQGREIAHVFNAPGYYATEPRSVALPPGLYRVKARAKDFPNVSVPVVIEAGRITRVHLDDAWQPSSAGLAGLVSLPAGYPVGWSAGAR